MGKVDPGVAAAMAQAKELKNQKARVAQRRDGYNMGTKLRQAKKASRNHAVLINGHFATLGSERALPEEDYEAGGNYRPSHDGRDPARTVV
jgi:hypothetical protein